MKVKKQKIIFFYILLEVLLLNISFFAVSYFKYEVFFREDYRPLLAIYNLAWLIIIFISEPHEMFFRSEIPKIIKDQLARSFLFVGIASPVVLLITTDNYSRTMIFGTVILFSILNFISFYFVSLLVIRAGKVRGFGSKLLILGADESGQRVLDFTSKNRHLGYDVVGFLDDEKVKSNGVQILGKIHDLPEILDRREVDEIIITLPTFRERDIKYAIETADYRGIRVNLVPNFSSTIDANFNAYSISKTLPVIEMRQIPLDRFNNFMLKKGFDIGFSLAALILLSPLMLLIAILLKIESKGPIFYRPVRKGQGNRQFVCYKFRSMYHVYDPKLKDVSTMKNDPRITRFGKFLRKYNLDELPQFFNVLIGDMSVVGPRPHRISLNDDMQRVVSRYMVRHYVKPGITGWAQVNGWRGPTATDLQKSERVKHDLWYIQNWTFALDLKIIFLTVFGSKTRQNAY